MASPSRSPRHDPYSVSSSPGLPSLDQIKAQTFKQPLSRSGGTPMPMPDHATYPSTSASSFVRIEHSAIDLTTPCKQQLSAAPIETPVPFEEEEVTVISIGSVPKVKRKRGVKVLEKKFDEPQPNSTKTAGGSLLRKKDSNTKKPAEQKETKAKGKRKATAKDAEVVSRHFAKPIDEEAIILPPPKKDVDEPLQLEAALRRRMDWTPPPADTVMASASKSSQVVDLLSSAARSPNRVTSRQSFQNLFKNYGRPEEEQSIQSIEPPDVAQQVLKKRKLIEAVSINESFTSVPIPKAAAARSKASKKKPRTMTELATAAYVVRDAPKEDASSAPPLDTVEPDAEAGKPKGKTGKRTAKGKKPKKMPPLDPVLLSPTTALRQAAKQDYVFGTSSQLAREHSPTFLRDLQTALQASNSFTKDEDPFVTPINSDAIEPEPRLKLWDVGARDEDGRLLDLEVINLADTPQTTATAARDGSDPYGYSGIEKPTALPPNPIPSDASFPDIDDLLLKGTTGEAPREHTKTSPLFSTIQSNQKVPDAIEAVLVSSGSLPDHEDQDHHLMPVRLPSTGKVLRTATTAPEHVPEPKKPNFDLYTDAQLSREIASYGFKPVKRRQGMLALLNDCWASKQRTALASLPTNHPMSTTSQAQATTKSQKPAVSASPKRPRGRPRKNSDVDLPSSEPPPSAQPPPPSPKRGRGRPKKTGEPTKTAAATTSRKVKPKASIAVPVVQETSSTVASPCRKKHKISEVVEIPDSASEGSLSPLPSTASSPEQTFSSPPPLDATLSLGEDTDMSLATPPTGQQSAALFVYITEAVTSAPPTTDPKKPSFHEMMLMYDPIVLEDLAAWLNTGQLSRVGYDGEVSATEVKQWCESKSVCCLWRESLRGKERKRY
ncbi:Structure-specific endonuclease subunit SLX4 [Colletotrichum chlorophyti]|uniref:Structure-specific endonuclease subunit SLX4 n=1 Tax=Colletotrichum chlorophyti TaxID=708187 RepID=A0A1Q8RM62_9PEZI|nr:Structure-specific endonuclease subunit SLX4 [Colletotrichum chlorophyti]